ncbi:MAG: hypothetical protein QM775_12590 [Pirellulales bacterium]
MPREVPCHCAVLPSLILAVWISNVANGQGFATAEPFSRIAERDASENDEIETDRDSFTLATTTAGRRRTIVESAYTFLDNRRVPDTNSVPELLLRHGVNDWFELRFGTNYEVGGAGNPVSANIPDDLEDEPDLEEEANVSYGIKLGLHEQNGLLPRAAITLQGATPTAGAATDTHFSTTYVAGWNLAGGATWDSAVRYGTGSLDDDHFNVWSPSTVLKLPIGERLEGPRGILRDLQPGPSPRVDAAFLQPRRTLPADSELRNRHALRLGPERSVAEFLRQRRRRLSLLSSFNSTTCRREVRPASPAGSS